MCYVTVSGSQGSFVYPLDDSYIHLALSNALAKYHVWGIGPYEFGSASSSPGWTLLLTGVDLVFGSHLMNALILNIVCALGFLFTFDAMLRLLRPNLSLTVRFVAQVVLVFCTPLPNLAFIGMEHVAQTWTIVLVCAAAVKILTIKPELPVPAGLVWLLLLSVLFAGTIRYEAVFAVIPIGLGLLLRRRRALTGVFLAFSAVGPIAFGLYSHHISGFWLPFSVMMKAQMEKDSTERFVTHFFQPNANGSMLQFLTIPILIWVLRSRKHLFWSAGQLMLLLTAGVIGLHLVLAPTRWLMRYESYFVALLIFAIFVTLPTSVRVSSLTERLRMATSGQKIAAAALGLVCLWLSPFLISRIGKGITQAPQSSIDRFDEHIQMARFVNRYFDHDTIVVNDIGAVAFYSDARLLDLYGLGSELPSRIVHQQHRMITRKEIEGWASANSASIAILQPEPKWLHEHIPASWIHVADWRTPRNLVFGDRTVGFYAISVDAVPRLCRDLSTFELTPEDRLVPQSSACSQVARR